MHRMLWSAALAVALVGGCAKDDGKRVSATDAAPGAPRHSSGFVAGAAGRPVARPLATPLYFEPNVGQADAQARFLARGPGFQLFLTSTGAMFKLAASVPCTGTPCASKAVRTSDVMRMAFAGANPNPAIDGIEPQSAHSNYFIGKDPAGWHRNVGRYAKVRYRGVYPGIDVVFYGNQQALEYDFMVAPHADTGAIAFDLAGVRDVRVDGDGNLRMKTPHGELQQHRPTVYQELHGKRVPVDGRYAVLGNGRVGFALGKHDPSAPVVIDPMFGFSEYVGGTSGDKINALATDAEGNTYVAGTTDSMDMVPGQTHDPATGMVFVTKFDTIGNVSYTTYLGGSSGGDTGDSIAVDALGRAYVAGAACSGDFPVVNAAQAYLAGVCDAFVARLAADGSGLDYATYFGGSGNEPYDGYDPLDSTSTVHVAVDSGGSAYITGGTGSLDLPVVNALQSAHSVDPGYAGYPDAFVAKLSPDGGSVVYATYLGGSRGDTATGIAVDANGNVYVAGRTSSPDFPVASAMQGALSADNGYEDAFVAEVSADGSALVYSTFLGGTYGDRATAITVDADGNAYLAGITNSVDFPFSQFPAECPGAEAGYPYKGFVAKVAALGQSLAYSACLKATNPHAIAVDGTGKAYLTGEAGADLPVADPMQPQLNTAGSVATDAFVTELAADGSALPFSTYLGGNDRDVGNGIAVDATGTIHVAGTTAATDFPTTNGSYATEGSANYAVSNGFVASIQDGVELSIADFRVVEGNDTHQVTFNVHLSSACTEPVTFDLDSVDFDPTSWAATEGVDYEPLHARGLVIPPGETDKAVTMTIYGDTTPESGAPTYLSYPGESFMVMFGDVTGAVVRDQSAVGTIGNDDALLSIGGMGVAEGASGENSTPTMLIRNLARSVLPVSFEYNVTGISATAGSDFSGAWGHATLEPGQDAVGPSITILGDDAVEPDETVDVTFYNVSNATPSQGTGTLTILNDDTTLSIADASITEGNSGTKLANFAVSLAQASATPVTFNVYTANGMAAAGSDYTATSRSVTIPAGSTSVVVSVPVIGDTAIEGNETFQVAVSYAVGATVADGTATGTIVNDDTTLSIADASVVEGDSGTKLANFTVALAQAVPVPVTFNVATANGGAGAGSDYVATSRTGVTIPAGGRSVVVSVPVIGDTAIEPNETFRVGVSSVVGATVADGLATGIIYNDDTRLSIADASIAEGASGTKQMTFTVRLSNNSAVPVTFNAATANKTAVSGSDYYARVLSGVSIPAGTTSKAFTIDIIGDRAVEANEAFLVNVSGVKGAQVADAQAIGTILNDEAVLGIADAAITEGNSGTKSLAFTVKLSAPLPAPVTLGVATANKTAVAGSDYVALALTGQSIPAGATSKVFYVSIKGDVLREPNETFLVNVSGVSTSTGSSVSVGDAQAVGTIVNDD